MNLTPTCKISLIAYDLFEYLKANAMGPENAIKIGQWIYGDIDKGTLNEYTQNRLGWD